ncbi:pilus assembly protein [Alsobacter metallidurans]|uniref:Pilus assembly protein n=1 Tax=Alsobacter metallidurans TaxID=340221 RepID=A0A917I3J7_9HYPH|nr:type II secretion system F family protein [Alsobacter metallidurans]GGH08582.1 pilus assembly protein [Alsobacter metallidurans]
MELDVNKLAVGLLAALAVGGAAYALIYPYLTGDVRGEQRQKALVAAGRSARNGQTALSVTARRDKVTASLKEIEARQTEANKLTLDKIIAQAGLDWTKQKYFLVSAAAGATFAAALFFLTGEMIAAVVGVIVGGLGLPRWAMSFMRKRRMKKFTDELPNAMDVIVRGIRSGLPLGDCMRIIATESAEPVRSEFRQVVEAQAMGVTAGEAVYKIYERVPVAEANFFAIVITIQQKSGGNLSEVLANLSKVIRERKKMRGKIQAMAMEAKASAYIIGSLPIFVGASVYATTPDYISLLWTTIHGRMFMGLGAFMMIMGTLVMRKMINFEV